MNDEKEALARRIALDQHPECEKDIEFCDVYQEVLSALTSHGKEMFEKGKEELSAIHKQCLLRDAKEITRLKDEIAHLKQNPCKCDVYFEKERSLKNEMPCGHKLSDVSTGKEGTSYCRKCEEEARNNEKNHNRF